MAQLIIIVDATTESAYLNQTLQELGRALPPASPVKLNTIYKLELFKLTSLKDSEMERLLRTICKAAKKHTLKAV